MSTLTARSLSRRDLALIGTGLASILSLMMILGALAERELLAQEPPRSGTQFEVASVKVNRSGDGRVMLGLQPGGRFRATNVPVGMLIQNAYRIQPSQLVGAPDWMNSARFDIAAKAEGDPSMEQVQAMVKGLLADRFKLQVHLENREVPIYALVLARADGKLGPNLKPAEVDCAELIRRRGRGEPPPPPPAPGARMPCAMRMGPGSLLAGGTTLSTLALSLSNMVRRVVQDHTGLTGGFDFELKWAPDQMPQGTPRDPNGPPAPTVDPNGASIFTALQEQLGLKLDSRRGQVESLVIDHIEQPTED